MAVTQNQVSTEMRHDAFHFVNKLVTEQKLLIEITICNPQYALINNCGSISKDIPCFG